MSTRKHLTLSVLTGHQNAEDPTLTSGEATQSLALFMLRTTYN